MPSDHPDKALEGGSQSTPGEYIDWLIDVVEACDRVLAPHGSLCIELGDTYAGSGGAGGDYADEGLRKGQPKFRQGYFDPARGRAPRATEDYAADTYVSSKGGTGWPLAKSLSLIPELFRLTLVYGFNPLTGRQTERWRLRNVIRWVRPNPPVGALGDKFRPATSELMVFCKSAKRYFDLDSVREPWREGSHSGTGGAKAAGVGVGRTEDDAARWQRNLAVKRETSGAPPLDWWNIPLLEGEEETRYGPKPRDITKGIPNKALAHSPTKGNSWGDSETKIMYENPNGAPPLDWWNIPPGGYEGAHYAVFPPELCVKPVKAMSPERVCRTCGEPSRRIVGEAEYVSDKTGRSVERRSWIGDGRNAQGAIGVDTGVQRIAPTLGFSDCGHDDWRPGLILDPFAGSGTTLAVATGHGRDAIGIDLDERNFDLALQRVGPFILERAS